jgi:hypothetical protein
VRHRGRVGSLVVLAALAGCSFVDEARPGHPTPSPALPAPSPAPPTPSPAPPAPSAPASLAAPTAPPAPTDGAPLDPSAFRAQLAFSSRVGRIIYLHDKVSAIATDLLLDRVGEAGLGSIGGYVAVPDPGASSPPSYTVSFFSHDAEPLVLYRVRVRVVVGTHGTVEEVSPPERPEGELACLIRARQTARAALGPVSQAINTVVLPARPLLDEDGILVYLLAATKRSGVAVLGKHHRVLVSADGRRVVRLEPLSKGIIEMSLVPPRPGARTMGLAVSHSVTPYPLETHVFGSLQNSVPIHVVTPRGAWEVDGDLIRFAGTPWSPDQTAPAPASSGPACTFVCGAAVGKCPHGPPDQADCVSRCAAMRAGPCARLYEEAFACGGPELNLACDARGFLTIGGCEQKFEAVLRCYARERHPQ